jgi:hypothetical protein
MTRIAGTKPLSIRAHSRNPRTNSSLVLITCIPCIERMYETEHERFTGHRVPMVSTGFLNSTSLIPSQLKRRGAETNLGRLRICGSPAPTQDTPGPVPYPQELLKGMTGRPFWAKSGVGPYCTLLSIRSTSTESRETTCIRLFLMCSSGST